MADLQNALIGTTHEELFRTTFQQSHEAQSVVKRSFGFDSEDRCYFGSVVGSLGWKADVILLFSNKRYLSANIKSFRGSGFNQATRSSISKFCAKFKAPPQIQELLIASTIRKAKDRKSPWIHPRDQPKLKAFLDRCAFEIIEDSILGIDNPDMFVLIRSETQEIKVFKDG